jgi:hypothetical protein
MYEFLSLIALFVYWFFLNFIENIIIEGTFFLDNLRVIFFDSFWDGFFLFLHTKFFILFVLFFPVLVCVFYFVLFLFGRFYTVSYKKIMESKQLIVFFGFFYFFLFVILFSDFIFYTETYRLFLVFPELRESSNIIIK